MWPASNTDGIWAAVHQWRLLACLWGYQGNGSWHSARTIFTNVTFTLLYINPNLFTSSKIKLLCKQLKSICCTIKNTLVWKYLSIREIHDLSFSLRWEIYYHPHSHGNKRTPNSQEWSNFKYCMLLSRVAQTVKNLSAIQETWVESLGQEDPLEKAMATHSRILAWRIP